MQDEFFYDEGQYCRARGGQADGERYVAGRGFVPCDAVMLYYRATSITKVEFQRGITEQLIASKPVS